MSEGGRKGLRDRKPAHGRSDALGAVLVGGESRRMGTDKARLPFRGRPLALHVAAVLEEVLGEVVLVDRGTDETGLPKTRFAEYPTVVDRFPGAGPLAGLHAALLQAASHDVPSRPGEGRAVFLAACDLPGLSPELVRHVLVRAGSDRLSESPRAWVPRFEDRRQPLAALYSPGCLAVVETLLEEGERAMHLLLDRLSVTEVPLTSDLPFYRPDLLANLNRPGDLERFEEERKR
jgi:molybdopterin-guanine dinucleotide biosynthesis protein A